MLALSFPAWSPVKPLDPPLLALVVPLAAVVGRTRFFHEQLPCNCLGTGRYALFGRCSECSGHGCRWHREANPGGKAGNGFQLATISDEEHAAQFSLHYRYALLVLGGMMVHNQGVDELERNPSAEVLWETEPR